MRCKELAPGHCDHLCPCHKDNAYLCDVCKEKKQMFWNCSKCLCGGHCPHKCPYHRNQAACWSCQVSEQEIWQCGRCEDGPHCIHKCPDNWQIYRLCEICVKSEASDRNICDCPKTKDRYYHCTHKCITGESDSGYLRYFHRDNCWCKKCLQNDTYYGAYANALSELYTLCYDCAHAPADQWLCTQCLTSTNERHCPHHCPVTRPKFNNTTLFFFVVGLILYMVNTGSDVALAIKYFTTGHHKWGAMTTACVVQLCLYTV